MSDVVGRVLGTDDATPLQFWVAVAPGSHLQLDDVVAMDRDLPSGDRISLYGVVSQCGPDTRVHASTAMSSSSRKGYFPRRLARRRRFN